MTQIILDILQYTGAFFGIIGGLMVASNTRYTKYGFIHSTIASILLSIWCFISREWRYFVLNLVYLCIDIFGVYRWFFNTKSGS